MAHIDHHAPGSFSWIELGTSDQNAAKTFYTSLFGWTFEDSPMGPSDFYTMFQLEGRETGAAYTQKGPEIEMHVPPHWNIYISVASADESAKKATGLGAKILLEPFDVFTFGRMAIIQDPAGAVFSIWEAKDHVGFRIQNQNGSFCWADLATPDQQGAAKFYSDLFGWTVTPGDGGYMHIKNGEESIGGVPPAHQMNPNVPPHWMIYIQVDDCDASTEKAKELGAKVYFGPMTIENTGQMTVLTDPQTAVFALFEPMRRG